VLFLILLRELFLDELLDLSQGKALSCLIPKMLGLELGGGAPDLKEHGTFELE
jgi:hypothetical protein